MANEFYNHAGYPAQSVAGRSLDMRAELLAITGAFNKMPQLAGLGDRLIKVNAAGTALETLLLPSIVLNTWVPVLTCTTPGNLTIVYSAQAGSYGRFGHVGFIYWEIITSTFTHTTASGSVSITGVPIGILGAAFGNMRFQGITKASYTQFAPDASGTEFFIRCSGSAQTTAILQITDMPTAGTVILEGTMIGLVA